MKQRRCLDLFCGAGGAAIGYSRAGFEVVGVDLTRQPRFPFEFILADALSLPLDFLRSFDVIHASPPCQAWTSMRTMHNAKQHVDLIGPTRERLRASGALYVIENVEGAPLIDPATLCGTMFGLGIDGAELRRHRLFETNFPLQKLACAHGAKHAVIGVYGGHVRNRKRREGSHARGVADFSPADGRKAMGIDHMTLTELSEAIPPVYAEFVGLSARQHLLTRRRA